MIKNHSVAIALIAVVIIIYGYLSSIPAYSQIPYLPNTIQSSSGTSQNSTIVTTNRSNNNSITSILAHLQKNTNSSSSSSTITTQSFTSNNNNNAKVVIINFDDSHKNQYTYAKPILDKYGFKATFFEVCNWVEAGYHDKDMTTTWKDISALQQDGMDIEAHTMNHPHINGSLSSADLDYEIGQSKQCLENHGINATIFAYPYGEGSNNSTVVNTVAKYYNLGRTDTKSALTFLYCDGGDTSNIDHANNRQNLQRDCRPYFNNGTLNPSNRYSINSWAHRHIERECSANNSYGSSCTNFVRHKYDNAQMFQKFVSAVNSENIYNKDGIIRAIPIIIYHTIDAEMKYLHDNGFRVLTMADLGYDENNNYLYIKNRQRNSNDQHFD